MFVYKKSCVTVLLMWSNSLRAVRIAELQIVSGWQQARCMQACTRGICVQYIYVHTCATVMHM